MHDDLAHSFTTATAAQTRGTITRLLLWALVSPCGVGLRTGKA
jgi:hypothetical protein